MTAYVRTIAVVLALGSWATPARAQDRPVEFDSWVLSGWSFTPSVGIAGVWDSNVAVAANQAEGRSTETDRVFQIEPQGQIEFRSPRTEFVGGYRGHLRRYVRADALNGFDQRGYLSVRHHVTRRLEIHARNEFDDVPTTDEIELNGIPYARFGARTNRLGAGVDFRVSRTADASIRYENTWVDFDNQENFYQGGVMNSVRAAYSVRLTARTRVGGEYRVRHSNLNDDSRVLWFHDMGGLVEQSLSPHVTLSVAGGYSQVRDPGLQGTRGGAYFRSNLTRELEHALVGVGFQRNFAPSFGFGGSSGSQELRGYVVMPFSRNRIYVNGSGMWRRTNPLQTEELALDSFIFDTTVGYGVSRWLRLEGFHRFTRQDSQVTGGEVNRHRAGVQVVISQPMRFQ